MPFTRGSCVPCSNVVLYVMLIQNFGPNATTYIIPSLLYSPLHKATCHGLSAAMGKVGAIVGAMVFLRVEGAFCPGYHCDDEKFAKVRNASIVFGNELIDSM